MDGTRIRRTRPKVATPHLVRALIKYGYRAPAEKPEAGLAIWAEALAGARQLDAWVPDREGMLAAAIDCYERQLSVMGRHAETGVEAGTESPAAAPSVESVI